MAMLTLGMVPAAQRLHVGAQVLWDRGGGGQVGESDGVGEAPVGGGGGRVVGEGVGEQEGVCLEGGKGEESEYIAEIGFKYTRSDRIHDRLPSL